MHWPVLIGCAIVTMACSPMQSMVTGTNPGNITLKLKPGDVVKAVTIDRERFRLQLTDIREGELIGESLQWEPSSASPGDMVVIVKDDLAVIMEEHSENPAITYPTLQPEFVTKRTNDCASLDLTLRQVDAIRWSMRTDGAQLDTSFKKLERTALSTALFLGVSIVSAGHYPPSAFLTGEEARGLQAADALLIALMTKREQLGCGPAQHCRLQPANFDTLAELRSIREFVENGQVLEQDALHQITGLLDDLCLAN